ncbi:hypothetical protein AgCh_030996 [Apium graveolens]
MFETTSWRDDLTTFIPDGFRIGVAAAPPATPTVSAVLYGADGGEEMDATGDDGGVVVVGGGFVELVVSGFDYF